MPRGAPPGRIPQAACPAGCEPFFELVEDGAVATWCELPDGRKHGPYMEWWQAGQLRMRGQYQFGGRTGTWISFCPRGIKTREIEFWEGDIHGKAMFWYEGGNPWKAGHYRRNMEHGAWAWFHREGGKWVTGTYEKGKKHGVWRQYARNGRILGECSFDHGTGRDVVFYDNGLIQAQADYVDGRKHGQVICWHENGKKAFVQGWERGHPAGRWITWDEVGNIVKVEEYTGHEVGHTEDTKLGDDTQVFRRRMSLTKNFIDVPTSKLYHPDEATEILADEARQAGGLPHFAYVEGEVTEFRDARPDEPERLQKFYRDRHGTILRIEAFSDGKRSKTTFYRGGEPYRIQRWHSSGNLASEGELHNLERHGTWTHWHENGQRAFVGTYEQGKPSGRFTRWNRDGRLLGDFEIPGGTGTWQDWHENGQVSEEGQLLEGKEAGPWTYYGPSGAVIKVVEFEGGMITAVDGDDTVVS